MSTPRFSIPLLFPTLSSFLPCPRERCDWGNRAALCRVLCPSVTILVAGDWNGIKLPNWAIRAIFIPARLFLWAHAPNIDLAQVTLMKHVRLFRWFKSTYVICSPRQQEPAIPSHLGLILQLSPPVITVSQTQARVFSRAALRGRLWEVEKWEYGWRSNVFTVGRGSRNPRKTCWVWPTSFS